MDPVRTHSGLSWGLRRPKWVETHSRKVSLSREDCVMEQFLRRTTKGSSSAGTSSDGAPSSSSGASPSPPAIAYTYDEAISSGILQMVPAGVRCSCSPGDVHPRGWGPQRSEWPRHRPSPWLRGERRLHQRRRSVWERGRPRFGKELSRGRSYAVINFSFSVHHSGVGAAP